MARLPSSERKYEVTHLWDIHHEIMRLSVAGMKPKDIARVLNVSVPMVSYTMNSTIAKNRLDIMRGARDADAIDIHHRIQELAPVAVDKLEELLDSEIENIKLKAATDILDRAGHGAVKTLRTENIHAHFTGEEIEEMKERARLAGAVIEHEA